MATISFALHPTLKATARILVLTAVAAPFSAFPQPAPEADSGDALRTTAEETLQTLPLAGADARDLIGPQLAAALRYEENGVHDLAIVVIEEALQIVRSAYGLYSLEQAPLLQRLIVNEEARGNVARAWGLEQELLVLARRHPDDLRIVPVLREVADRRMLILRRYVGGEFPPEIVLGCYYSSGRRATGRNCRSGSRSAVVGNILAEARRHYTDAIQIVLRQELDVAIDELRELDMALVRTSYRYGHYLGSYEIGRRSLVRLAATDRMNSEPLLTRVTSLLGLIDWELLFVDGANRKSRDARNEGVLERYEEAHELLVQGGTPQASIDALFSPPTPIVLPTFLPNPLASHETQASPRYIDVAFVITRHGESDQIEILDSSMNATEAQKDELFRLIETSRFRPRATDGQFADTSPVVVRYHLNE
ncbi:hypothetical protein [Candidatus Rariloculus sp.]|uniref:hypothetical protein n=1 Tax=Candidatus Rariloculus sp. TaxID=3101265 RepID=UPI003D13A725